MIDKTKVYRTRDGREVRIYATDHCGDFPVEGAVNDGMGWARESWTASGREYCSGADSGGDLIEVKPEREGWINVYDKASGRGELCSVLYPNKLAADTIAFADRIACLHVKFREGDGL